jgi:hypothetical protein
MLFYYYWIFCNQGSERQMRQLYQDGLSLGRKYGVDLLVTFTLNVDTPELDELLRYCPGERGPAKASYLDRPDLCIRVFWLRFKAFLKEILVDHVLGNLFLLICAIQLCV